MVTMFSIYYVMYNGCPSFICGYVWITG